MDKFGMLFSLNKYIFDLMCYVFYITRLSFYLKESKIRKKNLELRKNKKTPNCYILGLGPSLDDSNLLEINEDIIVVNRYYLYARQNNITKVPSFYCVTDSYFYEDTKGFEELKEMLFEFKTTCFILNGLYRKVIENEIGIFDNVYYIYMWGTNVKKNSVIDFTKTIPIGINIVCTAIALAIYLKYNNIYLLGCDFNSFAQIYSEHCYKKDNKQREISLSLELFYFSFAADQHCKLNECATKNDIRVINKTKNSLIDAYERQ